VVLIRKNVGTQITLMAILACATATGSVTTSITTRLELSIFYILRSYDVLIPPPSLSRRDINLLLFCPLCAALLFFQLILMLLAAPNDSLVSPFTNYATSALFTCHHDEV
jgi:hypothetical protein